MYMTNGTASKGVSDIPCSAVIGRGIDVDFIAMGVIKIFSPEEATVGRAGDM